MYFELDEIDYNHRPLLFELKQAHLNLQEMEVIYRLINDLTTLSQSINQRVENFEQIDATNQYLTLLFLQVAQSLETSKAQMSQKQLVLN